MVVVVFAGIANALDLTDRILPRLQARPHCRPLLLHFPPYSRQELTAIVQDRLAQVNVQGAVTLTCVRNCLGFLSLQTLSQDHFCVNLFL